MKSIEKDLKDVFDVHSREDSRQWNLYRTLKQVGQGLGISLWDYPDWNWETLGTPEYYSHSDLDKLDRFAADFELDPRLARIGYSHPYKVRPPPMKVMA